MSEKNKNWSSIGKLIFCPNCKAKIRPNKEMVGEIDIKCPSCKYEFQWLIKEYKWQKEFKNFKKIADERILQIQKRKDISTDEKVTEVIKVTSILCASLATQPLPGMDIFYLTPIQGYMGIKISEIRKLNFKESKIKTMIKEASALIGLGMAGQNFVLTAYKIGIPYFGGIMTIPLVYGATYGIGRVMDFYFIKKAKNQKFDPEELKKIWEETLKQKKAEGKEKRKDIWESIKNYEA